ncbi:CaiB/BaiF CoA-transferase family protein [Nocardioides zeae]|uniref:CoA transferase n=1 Tax=Nocardioides zeae TaxID=1457234 RepID=A0A6P0HMA3_9ACTN|nr:CoA transferase [Nocardioides zeae]NEN79726.1 CoA transferase [Nocardioides zeae]
MLQAPEVRRAVLDDVVILEIGTGAAVGYAGKLLRDAGATVVLVEHDGASEVSEAAARDLDAYMHGGKRSVTTRTWDLAAEHPALVARADAVVCDDPRLLEVARSLRNACPDLVVVSISDYGSTAPPTPANEFTLQAEAGLTALHPTGDLPPVVTGVPLGDLASAIHAAIGVVAGMMSREAGGGAEAATAPVDADVSRYESLVSSLQFPWVFAQHEQHTPYAIPVAPVPGIEEAADGWVCVVCVTPQQWIDFRTMAGVPELASPRYDQLIDRQDLIDELTPLIRSYTRQHTVDELVRAGAAARVPIVPVSTSTSVRDLPPYAERGSFVTHPDGFVQPRPAHRVDGVVWEPMPRPHRGEADAADWGPRPARQRRSPGDPQRPLRGTRVVEMGSFQAGPLVTRALAELGADVVKLESVMRPDLLRFGGPLAGTPEAWELGASFTGTNWGKRSLTADLKDADGSEIVRRLIASSDIVVENFSPRVLDSIGLDAAGIEELRPGAVVLRLPAWGSEGSWRDVPGFTYSADAACGMSDLTGYADGPPTVTGTTIDPIAAASSTLVALAAVRRQVLSGHGAHVEIPLCDVAIQLTAAPVIASSRTAVPISRRGNDSVSAVPQGVYRSKDQRWVALSVTDEQQWSSLSALLSQDLRSASPVDAPGGTLAWRTDHRDLVDQAVRALVASSSAEDVLETLRAVGIPATELGTGLDVHQDPRLIARGRTMTLPHVLNGDVVHLRAPVRLSFDSGDLPRHSPLFGEHNHEVLGELGYSADEIARLEDAGKIGVSPFGLPTRRVAGT